MTTTVAQTSDYLSQSAVARRVGVNYDTIRIWVRRGDFPAPDVAAGRHVRLWRPETVAPFILDGPGLTMRAVARALDVSRGAVRYWLANGSFPAPDVQIGADYMRWRPETVVAWRARTGL